MLNSIHSDVLYYILHTYLYYSSDLRNLSVLFQIKFALKTHLHTIIIDKLDSIDIDDCNIGATRTFLDDKLVYYKYDHTHFNKKCFYYGKYAKIRLCWSPYNVLNHCRTYNIMEDRHFREGFLFSWHNNGNLHTATKYGNSDIKNGFSLSLYHNGTLEYIHNYLHNRLHGLSLDWYQNGIKKFKGYYNYKNPIGEHIYWNESGKLLRIENYDKTGNYYGTGNLERVESYDGNGNLVRVENYNKNGKLERVE